MPSPIRINNTTAPAPRPTSIGVRLGAGGGAKNSSGGEIGIGAIDSAIVSCTFKYGFDAAFTEEVAFRVGLDAAIKASGCRLICGNVSGEKLCGGDVSSSFA